MTAVDAGADHKVTCPVSCLVVAAIAVLHWADENSRCAVGRCLQVTHEHD